MIVFISLNSFAQNLKGNPNRDYPLCTYNLQDRQVFGAAEPELMSLDSFLRHGGLPTRNTSVIGDTCKNCSYLPLIYNKDSITAASSVSTAASTSSMATSGTTTATNTGTTATNTASTAANTGILIRAVDSLVLFETNGGVMATTSEFHGTVDIGANTMVIAFLDATTGARLTTTLVTGWSNLDLLYLANTGSASSGAALPVLPVQSYKLMTSVHTITCNNTNGCIFFIVTLN